MSKLESLITVEYHGKKYTIAGIKNANNSIPILLDRHIYKLVKKLDKTWYVNNKDHIFCIHHSNDDPYYVYLHDIVMKISMDNNEFQKVKHRSVVHINNIHYDNRIDNLQYDIKNKDHSKNMKKKKRIIDLAEHNINVDNLPTYIWYIKPDDTHGARFSVEIPNYISWKTTSSKKLSLRYKLEEA